MARSDVSSDNAGVRLPPPLIYVTFFLVGIGLQRYVPLPGLAVRMPILGPALVLTWAVFAAWSFWRMWASGTSVLPFRPTTALVIEGPYRLTRNPMYLSLLLLYAGVACWFGWVWPLLLMPILVWTVHVAVIAREERYLTRKFGDDYRQYQTHVRRWL